MQLYVGNIATAVNGRDLAAIFAPHGTVRRVRRAIDPVTGAPRGHALVLMGSAEEAQAALTALNGAPAAGETLSVRKARLRPRS